ncbi:hypothetical protein LCGC14_0482040 [marine sediment metagenome]|uniref:ACT domain-containing protein n=1 Tax=marine sediment metagenome TaxID=412755 RepID=A0A0F9UW40_9ZZZZ|nr:MAG: hypothetical protein Lokiarch_27720 [Candidatus Lokiarchaeum sp. GC14_75]HEC38447.1 hypothetical protein [bacterium]
MKVKYYLDVLKAYEPGVEVVARNLLKINGVTKVHIKVDEVDQKTSSLYINVEGTNLTLDEIIEILDSMNCALHSVDLVEIEKED